MNSMEPPLQSHPKRIMDWAVQNRWIAAYIAAILLSLLLAFCGESPPEASPSQEAFTPVEPPAPTETLSTMPIPPKTTAAPDTLPDFGSFLPRKFQELRLEDPEMRAWTFFVDEKASWAQLKQHFEDFIGPAWVTPPDLEAVLADFEHQGMFGDNFHLTQYIHPGFPEHALVFGHSVQDETAFVIINLFKHPHLGASASF